MDILGIYIKQESIPFVDLLDIKKEVDGIYRRMRKKHKKDFNVILSFDKVKRINSGVAGCLNVVFHALKKAGKELVLSDIRDSVKREFQFLGIAEYIKVFETFDKAAEYLNGN